MGLISRVSSRTYREKMETAEVLALNAERQQVHRILCCQCGEAIEPNATNMCVSCVRTTHDITQNIPRQGAIAHCKGCGRWLSNNKNINSWITADRESRDLLAQLLNRVKDTLPKEMRLVDAIFIWTEPHSKRLKINVTVEQSVQLGAILRQSFVVEFIEAGGMCNECHRLEAKDFWKSVIQVRQKRSHKKTFLYLEQLILKHEAHRKCVKIAGVSDGLDFFFADKQTARKFLEFLQAIMPIKWTTSQKLISHDVHTSSYNYKYTTLVELPLISKDDIVCLPKAVCQKFGNIGPIVACLRITQTIQLIDFQTLDYVELQREQYWRNPFGPLSDKLPLKEYMVMDVEPRTPPKTSGVKSRRHELSQVWIVPTDKLGSADQSNWIFVSTHLGKLFNTGDLCMGFDVKNSNVSEINWDLYKSKTGDDKIPDVIIIRKSHGNNWKRHKRRQWKVERLDVVETESRIDDTDAKEQQMLEFLNEVEEDEEIKKGVKVYRNEQERLETESQAANDEDDIAEDCPELEVEEMLESLKLDMTSNNNTNNNDENEMD